MSQQSLEQFLATVIQDEEMSSRIGDDVDTIEALIAFGSEQDFEFTEEDLQEFVELTDDELDSVAGGTIQSELLAESDALMKKGIAMCCSLMGAKVGGVKMIERAKQMRKKAEEMGDYKKGM